MKSDDNDSEERTARPLSPEEWVIKRQQITQEPEENAFSKLLDKLFGGDDDDS